MDKVDDPKFLLVRHYCTSIVPTRSTLYLSLQVLKRMDDATAVWDLMELGERECTRAPWDPARLCALQPFSGWLQHLRGSCGLNIQSAKKQSLMGGRVAQMCKNGGAADGHHYLQCLTSNLGGCP